MVHRNVADAGWYIRYTGRRPSAGVREAYIATPRSSVKPCRAASSISPCHGLSSVRPVDGSAARWIGSSRTAQTDSAAAAGVAVATPSSGAQATAAAVTPIRALRPRCRGRAGLEETAGLAEVMGSGPVVNVRGERGWMKPGGEFRRLQLCERIRASTRDIGNPSSALPAT